MTDAAISIRDALLKLPEADRAWLAGELVASRGGEPDGDAAELWDAEIERRATAVRSGASTLKDWGDVTTALERRLLKH